MGETSGFRDNRLPFFACTRLPPTTSPGLRRTLPDFMQTINDLRRTLPDLLQTSPGLHRTLPDLFQTRLPDLLKACVDIL